MSLFNLQVNPLGNVNVTQRYPTITVNKVMLSGSGGGISGLANARIYTDGQNNKWLQFKDPNTNQWGTVFSVNGQVVIGPGQA